MSEQVQMQNNQYAILRRTQVEARTGLSRATIYARITAGTFPRQIDLGAGGAVGWIEAEIDAWVKARIEASRLVDIVSQDAISA